MQASRFVYAQGLRSLWRAAPFLALLLIIHLALSGEPRSQEPPPKPPSTSAASERVISSLLKDPQLQEKLERVSDPVTLKRIGQALAKSDRKEEARAAFELSQQRDEINEYSAFNTARGPGEPPKRTIYATALLLETEGNFEVSRALWNLSFFGDVLGAYSHISRASIDPQKNKLLADAKKVILRQVGLSRAGLQPHTYSGRGGKSWTLNYMTGEEAIAAFKEGKRINFAFIEELDLSNQVFEKKVSCTRCITGSIKGYGSEFKERLHFKGIVLGDVHLGKKWKGAVNDSPYTDAAIINRLYLRDSVIFGDLNLESIKLEGRLANLPLIVVEGNADLRSADFKGLLEMRFSQVKGHLNLKGAEIHGAAYFGHAQFGGAILQRVTSYKQPLLFNSVVFSDVVDINASEFRNGMTFEDAQFWSDMRMSHSHVDDRLNFSRATFSQGAFIRSCELDSVDFLGTRVLGRAELTDSIIKGNARFALDGLTRRRNLGFFNKELSADPKGLSPIDAPVYRKFHPSAPLHKLYKEYQGDVDTREDLTTTSQYGVVHVDDLNASFEKDVSFANTVFEKFVSFEGVRFGTPGTSYVTSFYNTQFFGEAHFERTVFRSDADFRTIFGNELSFNGAQFFGNWLLDDANIPGRLGMSGAKLLGDATVSFFGARIAALGVTFAQLQPGAQGESTLFYERCAESDDATLREMGKDPRLEGARWDAELEIEITDEEVIQKRLRLICLKRTVGEFVVLRSSFNKRSMTAEGDWAYWNLRHYKNIQKGFESESIWTTMGVWGQTVLFEWGFGWGVRMVNLLWTSLTVVLLFMILFSRLCSNVLVNWDDKIQPLKELPLYALFVISFHSFLGRARDWKSHSSNNMWKILYTSEMIIGIILITFFIGAYTRAVLR